MQLASGANTEISLWIITLAVIGGSLLSYYLISWLILRVGKKNPNSTLVHAWRKFKSPSLVIVLLLDFILLKEFLNLGEKASKSVGQFITVAIIFCITWLLIKGINLAREVVLRQYDIDEKDNLKARSVYTQFRILEKIIIFIVILIATAIALMTFDGIKRIGISLFASAGVAGIMLGFAAQKMLGSILAGFQIAIAQPIRVEDVVIVEGEWGWIEEINLTYVVVRIWDKRRLVVPTTYFIEKPFQNWTRVSADILGTVFIYTDYQVPIEKLREEFTRILETSDLWDGKVNVMQVTNATEKTVEIRALMSTVDSPTGWDLRVLVREKLISYLQENYPESLPKMRVEMNPSSKANTPQENTP
ncbi:MAG: mechanosensitive ion channel [Bacteroides sp.]|nr:mechanosensitive ion channel [Bacteroides sp.]